MNRGSYPGAPPNHIQSTDTQQNGIQANEIEPNDIQSDAMSQTSTHLSGAYHHEHPHSLPPVGQQHYYPPHEAMPGLPRANIPPQRLEPVLPDPNLGPGAYRGGQPVENGGGRPAANSISSVGGEVKEGQVPPHEEPKGFEGEDGERVYRLEVVQQPQRARMCGFGDKDRRPITPPPCIRLAVIDKRTGKEVDCNEVDHQLFVLNVDLWRYDGKEEVNLVKSSQTSPSISSTTQQSYREIENGTGYSNYANILPSTRDPGYGAPPYGQPPQMGGYPGYQGGYNYPGQYYGQNPEFGHHMPPHVPSQQVPMYPGQRFPHDMSNIHQRMGFGGQGPQGMYTRNMIGSLATNANRLVDPSDKIGIWFILQDLSVRTEGHFRLRLTFTKIQPPREGDPSDGQRERNPVLSCCFSNVFTVYSAKKFPGVCESTQLSKCFATQGIKIPIRKEGEKGKKNGDDDEEDY